MNFPKAVRFLREKAMLFLGCKNYKIFSVAVVLNARLPSFPLPRFGPVNVLPATDRFKQPRRVSPPV